MVEESIHVVFDESDNGILSEGFKDEPSMQGTHCSSTVSNTADAIVEDNIKQDDKIQQGSKHV